jgi:hypothetical protein
MLYLARKNVGIFPVASVDSKTNLSTELGDLPDL